MKHKVAHTSPLFNLNINHLEIVGISNEEDLPFHILERLDQDDTPGSMSSNSIDYELNSLELPPSAAATSPEAAPSLGASSDSDGNIQIQQLNEHQDDITLTSSRH